VINNGAAGMANFSGTRHGVISRLAAEPVPRVACILHRLYGADTGSLDGRRARRAFRYRGHWDRGVRPLVAARIGGAHFLRTPDCARGPNYSVDQALGRVAAADCAALDA
jgi:hypothetical protein